MTKNRATPWMIAGACMVVASLAGCGNFNTAYRSESVDNLRVISVDAKQRFTFIKTSSDGQTIVCPEPSPDALSAGAASLSLDASKVSVADLRAAFGSAEQASSIGLRTQSIQLLRDQLAYLCLLRLADKSADADPSRYLTLFKRYQSAVLGVLAIEQLTGAIRAPAVTVSASGSATVNVGAASKPADAASQAAATEPSSSDASQSGAADASANDKAEQSKIKTADASALSAAATQTKGSTTKKSSTTSASKDKTTGVIASATTSIPLKPLSQNGPATESDVATIAEAVYKIVNLLVTTAFQAENCFAANADPKSPVNLVSGCNPAQEKSSCVDAGNSEAACNKYVTVKEATRQDGPGAANSPTALADAASRLQQRYSIPVSVDVPFQAMRYGIFRCSGTDPMYASRMEQDLLQSGVPADRINTRGEFLRDELQAKGFPGKNQGEILYDPGIRSEVNVAASLVPHVQSVLDSGKAGQRALASENTREKTPLYLSIAICAS